jgi:acyl-CoA synthetase (AMP-forming)/AMP-acid ligase II
VKKQIGSLSSSFLQKVGLKRGQVVGLILPNIPEYIPTIHGALEAGLVVTFVNPIYTEGSYTFNFVFLKLPQLNS